MRQLVVMVIWLFKLGSKSCYGSIQSKDVNLPLLEKSHSFSQRHRVGQQNYWSILQCCGWWMLVYHSMGLRDDITAAADTLAALHKRPWRSGAEWSVSRLCFSDSSALTLLTLHSMSSPCTVRELMIPVNKGSLADRRWVICLVLYTNTYLSFMCYNFDETIYTWTSPQTSDTWKVPTFAVGFVHASACNEIDPGEPFHACTRSIYLTWWPCSLWTQMIHATTSLHLPKMTMVDDVTTATLSQPRHTSVMQTFVTTSQYNQTFNH